MQPRRTPLVNVMVNAAQKAGRGLRRAFGEIEKLQVSKKGPADYVSEADHRAEKTLFEELQHARPKFGFIMEESGIVEGSDNSNRWIIDPLDGTLNFLHGLPHFCISIALERDREIFAGVVYEPITDQLFWAEKGQGAFLNDNRLRVSSRRDMSESLFATGIPFAGREGHKEFLTQLENVMAVSAGVRRAGSAALDLAYVAAGRYDGFWEQNLNSWDIAAGIILVREAGGTVTDFDGKNDMLSNGSIIAANHDMHRPLKKLITA
jgi:myo-inositol-1(or 4)-monophosphatase